MNVSSQTCGVMAFDPLDLECYFYLDYLYQKTDACALISWLVYFEVFFNLLPINAGLISLSTVCRRIIHILLIRNFIYDTLTGSPAGLKVYPGDIEFGFPRTLK